MARLARDPTDEKERELLRRHQRTGRPLGGERFIDKLERIVGRKLRPQKPGRPRTNENQYCVSGIPEYNPSKPRTVSFQAQAPRLYLA